MSAIGPGDLVECVESRTHRAAHITCGTIYTVDSVIDFGLSVTTGQLGPGVRLTQIETRWSDGFGAPGYWRLEHFRPAGRRDESLIKDLLRPVDQPAERVSA